MKKSTPVLLVLLIIVGLLCFAAMYQVCSWGMKAILLLKHFNWHQVFEGVKRFFRYDIDYAVSFVIGIVVSYIMGYCRGAVRRVSDLLDRTEKEWDEEDSL